MSRPQPTTDFAELSRRAGLPLTHQRQVIYDTLMRMPGHPSPEEVYAKVRRRIPSISLATVYKNLNRFLKAGLLQEMSVHHGSLRVEVNDHPHHHLVCASCKKIEDIDSEQIGPLQVRGRLPKGFAVQRFSVDVIGLCARCSSKKRVSH
jgi:Fur family transcriptional regulator, peroxide stress response regulator